MSDDFLTADQKYWRNWAGFILFAAVCIVIIVGLVQLDSMFANELSNNTERLRIRSALDVCRASGDVNGCIATVMEAQR